MEITEYVPKSFMAIFAHPDDIEFSCAGTTAKWVAAGARAAYVLVTSGDVGIADLSITKADAAKIREEETRAAAAVSGVTDVTFLRVSDGMVENTMELRKRLVREIRRFQPEVIITGDPTMVYSAWGGINHPDHRAVATATFDAVFPATGQPHLFQEIEIEEGFKAHKVRKVFVVAYDKSNAVVDISSTIEKKIEALLKHDSQVGHMEGLGQRMRDRAAERAKDTDVEFAEVFRVLTIESDETWEKLQAKAPEQYAH